MNNPPLHIKGAFIWHGAEAIEKDLFIQNGRIVDKKPNHALEIDLSGYTLFPGLVNAHDHLELNHFPRTKFRDVYDNAHQWGEDVNARLNDEPFKTLRSYPLWDRVFIGGLKNLLCGATTVAHHGPKHKPMYRTDFPVRVLKNYGWAHSLHFSSEAEIIQSYQSTPKHWPWFIHLAEGIDEIAASEYQRLKKLGCIGENTVIVHGVGMREEDIEEAAPIVRGLVWCPTTNIYLLEKTVRVDSWLYFKKNVAFGSDSRLTGDGDLITESIPSNDYIEFSLVFLEIESMPFLTTNAAKIIGLPDVGHLETGAFADFSIPCLDLWERGQIDLIVRDGTPQIGDPELMARFPHIQTIACTLDGVEKCINIELARQIHRCKLKEQGLELDALPKNKKFIFF